MSQSEFERLNFLSEKSLVGMVTTDELTEFSLLMKDWNTSKDFNLFQGLSSYKGLPEA